MPVTFTCQTCGRPAVCEVFNISKHYVKFCESCLQGEIDSAYLVIESLKRENDKTLTALEQVSKEAQLYRDQTEPELQRLQEQITNLNDRVMTAESIQREETQRHLLDLQLLQTTQEDYEQALTKIEKKKPTKKKKGNHAGTPHA